MKLCPAKFEPRARRDQTHTCEKLAGHEGDHRCPTCECLWAGSTVTDPVKEKSVRSGSENRLRRHQVNVRMSDAEVDRLLVRAAEQGLTAAQLVRADQERIARLFHLLDQWDTYSKGPSMTTKQIRAIFEQEVQ